MPFIVRQETGYSLRDQYRIAALWDPARHVDPRSLPTPGQILAAITALGLAAIYADWLPGSAQSVKQNASSSQPPVPASNSAANASGTAGSVVTASRSGREPSAGSGSR